MIIVKNIILSKIERDTIERVRKDFMTTELSCNHGFGETIYNIWTNDDISWDDFSIDRKDMKIIKDIINGYVNSRLNEDFDDMENFIDHLGIFGYDDYSDFTFIAD